MGTILTPQTTFWEIATTSGVVRIHFSGKQEQKFVRSECTDPVIVHEHPILLDYKFPGHAIYISRHAADPHAVLDRLVSDIGALVAPWRDPLYYFNKQHHLDRADSALSILTAGHGLLCKGPTPVRDAVRRVLDNEGIRYTELPEGTVLWPMQALIAGENFVIAMDFRTETL